MTKWLKNSDGAVPVSCDQILVVPWGELSYFLTSSHWATLAEAIPRPTGNQSWFQEGQNGTAELPVVRRLGTKPHCLPAHQCLSREAPVWQEQLTLFTRRHDPHVATDGGSKPEALSAAPGVICSPGLRVGTAHMGNVFPLLLLPCSFLSFSRYHDYLPLSLLWGCHVASCLLGILQSTP